MRPCSRTIDRPLLILGLEGEDVAVLMLLCGIPAVLFSPAIPVIGLLIVWPLLAAFKRGKPEGYVLHFLYSLGMSLRGLLPPQTKIRYSPYPRNKEEKRKN
ncbi:MAG: hypothetical protein HQL16_04795 [Candidatus Omnitrophica bacterium]|nr:hypothetical protein [Candidatus Omnitrophota bacterium]